MWSLIDYILQLTPYSELSGRLHPAASVVIAFVLLIAGYVIGSSITNKLFGRDNFPVKDKHVLITGGSQGLGKALAILLAKKGAHVSIVARNKQILDNAIDEIQAEKLYPHQTITSVAADVTDHSQVVRAFDEVTAKHDGKTPDYVICCAGATHPRLFLEQPIKEFEDTMRLNYFGSLFVAHEGVKRMVHQGVKGKVVFVSSTVGFVGFVGYSEYAPTKYALRGLSECLRNELLLYDIGVHCFFPGNIRTPGYETENKTKPQVTKRLEGEDDASPPEVIAAALYKGLRKGQFFITSDLLTDILRAGSHGMAPTNNAIVDVLFNWVSWIISFPYIWYGDQLVKSAKNEIIRNS
ncbi:3174_t:CDS:2 [Paraglomus occultum]|uniref:3-dehydrosphinganine reductase n=1 Tax=Paraglomus occultum TaxID=144539 RepID=A0A9N9AJX1_9GLOM|nr:3174_t:CDS:2 [Paraglomus occultum]